MKIMLIFEKLVLSTCVYDANYMKCQDFDSIKLREKSRGLNDYTY